MKLRLSPFVLPQLRQGLHNLKPQNLTAGQDRVHYARVVVHRLTSLVEDGQIELAKRLYAELAFASNLLLWHDEPDGKTRVEPLPELANALSFDLDAVGVLLRDGRLRDDSAMMYIPTGAATAGFTTLLRRLHTGVSRTDLLAEAEAADIGFDEQLLDEMIARGAIEPGEPPSVPRDDTTPAIEWLGHAYVRAIGRTATAWFDPFTSPRQAWAADEREAIFATDVPDQFLLDNYGPDAHQITQDELAIPDAIFITHQDTDHMDLGVLSLVPPTVPIYVPASDPRIPWQVDLVAAIRTLLGPDRNVVVLRHGETIDLDDIRVTAFPFVGEFPTVLPHNWNCYLVELPDQVWALCADSAVTEVQLEWLKQRRAGDHRSFGIMVNGVKDHATTAGYFDSPFDVTTFTRLYSWYVTPAQMFVRTPACGLPVEMLRRLVREANLQHVYPYAHGNLPWYRLTTSHLHHSHVNSHSLEGFVEMEHMVAAVGARVLRLKHGVPHVGAPTSPLRSRVRG
jgi:L-ascorbate metabolism protein UlaG (beta-lactamase superfamily)